MKQLSFFSKSRMRREHGGLLLIGKRRTKRPLSVKEPLHLVLRSDFAYGSRSLVRHRPLIDRILKKAAHQFHVRVYEKGLVSNHIHLAVKGKTPIELHNFFRVVAGHIAQEILRKFPIQAGQRPWPGGASHKREKDNKFWQTRIYSRIVAWGRDYKGVKSYVIQNALEGLGLIPYRKRRKKRRDTS